MTITREWESDYSKWEALKLIMLDDAIPAGAKLY